MSKAIEGAAMLAGAVAIGAAEFLLASTGVGIAALPFLTDAMFTLAAGGVAMEAGAIAGALMANRGMNITTRQPAAARQIIYGQQRVGGVSVYQSTTGSSLAQENYVVVVAGHACMGVQALYLDGRKVWFTTSDALPYPLAQDSSILCSIQPDGIAFGGGANGNTYTGPDGNQYSFGALVFAQQYLGDQDAARWCGSLQANDPNWAPSASGTPYLGGCTFLYIKCEYYPSVFPNAPEIRVTMDGKVPFDPRTDAPCTVETFANSALVIADWLQDTVYGLGMTVNQEQLIAAANVCDEQIPLAAGGTESQYQCHYHFDTSTAPSDALATMLKSCGGRISVIGGEVYIWPAYWQGPSANFDESVLTAPVQWDSTAAYKDNCNFVTGTYTAPNYPYNVAGNLYDSNGFDAEGNLQNNFQFGFQPTSFPPYAQDPLHGYAANQWLNEDSGVSAAWSASTTYPMGAVVSYVTDITVGTTGTFPYYQIYKSLIAGNLNNIPSATSTAWQLADVNLPLEVNYNMVLSIAQAQRLAKIDLLRRRFWGRGQLEMGLSALALQELDVMYFTFPLHGWTEKLLEITGCTVKVSGQDGAPGTPGKPSEIRILFDVAETDPSIYEWSDTEELTIYDVPGVMQGPNSVPIPPTDLTVISSAATALVGLDGLVTPRLEVTWDTPQDGFATGVEIQYQLAGSGVWQTAGTPSIELNQFFIGPVIAGQQYGVQIRSIRANGATSAWVGPVTITAGLVLTIISQAGYGIGSLQGIGLNTGYAQIECNPFTAYIGQLTLSIFPAGAVLLSDSSTGAQIAQKTMYYVYYIDPNCLGGNVTPIATTNISDFLGKPGYFLIDSIVTPYAALAGATGGLQQYSPTTYNDVGTASTQSPASAFDGNLSTFASQRGNRTGGYGDCIFLGWPAITLSYAANLYVIASGPDTTPPANPPFSDISATVGSVVTDMTPSGVTPGTGTPPINTYTLAIPSGTLLSTVSVEATDDGGALRIYEIYIQ